MEILKTDCMVGKELICMVGLPYSGKSTVAKTHGYPIVNPDAIRVALHGKKFIPEAEPYVWAIAKTMVKSLFMAGHNTVVLDATNTTAERRKEWESKDWSTLFDVVETDKEECKKRAEENNDHIMVDIIERMSLSFNTDGIAKTE